MKVYQVIICATFPNGKSQIETTNNAYRNKARAELERKIIENYLKTRKDIAILETGIKELNLI